MGATACEFDVTPEIELTPKTAFKLTYQHHITCRQFDKAHADIERAKASGVISHDEWLTFLQDCLNQNEAYMSGRFGTDDEIRKLTKVARASS